MELIVSVVSIRLLPAQTTKTKKSTDQRKPFGCAITRFIFPSEHTLCNNTARAIARIKLQRMAFI
jgi:hypothetical protein